MTALAKSPLNAVSSDQTARPVDFSIAPSMSAVVQTGYGGADVLRLVERPTPTPAPDQVLIRVQRAALTTADSMLRRGTPKYARLFLGLRKPKTPIPGVCMAGTVVAVGKDVTRFAPGDDVFGEAGLNFGAHAEYVAVSQDGVLAHRPDSLSLEDAAGFCDGPVTSHNFLKRIADVQPGQEVLIVGASGSLGTAAVQIAKHMGARVTGVCSAANRDLVERLGADHVIDYRAEDFTKGQQRYDVIYDTLGVQSYRACKSVLAPDGIYMCPVLSMGLLFHVLASSLWGRRRARFDATGMRKAPELRGFIAELMPLVDRGDLSVVHQETIPLTDIARGYAIIDSGRKVGNLTLDPAR